MQSAIYADKYTDMYADKSELIFEKKRKKNI